jgi:predicted amidohydrolase YtcJ
MKVYYNANIYTPGQQNLTAFAVDQGVILAVGTNTEILQSFSHKADVVNLNNHTILPGLMDAHLHLQHLAASKAMIDCETPTLDECLEQVNKHAKTLVPDTWIRGHGWNQNNWLDAFGTAELLDRVSWNHPAYLTAKSLHAAWVNHKALELAGINAQTPDPPGGMIQRDSTGEPTGILFEAGAMALIEAVIPNPSEIELMAQVDALLPELWKQGLIGVHDFDGLHCWEILRNKRQTDSLDLRVRKNIPFEGLDQFINAGLRTNDGDDRLNIGNLKLFADGALGPQTAAMIEPYENGFGSGTLLLSEDEIFEIGIKAVNHGIALSIHAIGDLANRVVLNAYQRLRDYETKYNLPHLRHRIEHVQTIHPLDLPRLAQMDIIASVQPIHATSDMSMAEQHLGNRAKHTYPFKSLLKSGTTIVFGSDAPVETPNPFIGIHAAVTRRRQDGTPGLEGWYPEQRLTLDEAIAGYSYFPNLISNRGDYLGRVAQGYRADFIILNKDPFKIEPQNLAFIKPLATFIEGLCVFQNEDLSIDLG